MLIVRMTFSRAMACAGNQTRETLRSSMKLHGKSGMVLLNDKDVSPNANELDSASLRFKTMMVKLPKKLKPITREEETDTSTHGVIRGGWGERALMRRKIGKGVPGDPRGVSNGRFPRYKRTWESITM